MRPLETDWTFLERAVNNLQDYLLSPELCWTFGDRFSIGESIPLSCLTPGNLLLSLARLEAYPWQAKQSQILESLKERFCLLRNQWMSHWREKIAKEIPMRLSLWENYLKEATTQGLYAREYQYQVRSRVILSLLQKEGVSWKTHDLFRLDALDGLLFTLVSPGSFIWEAELEGGFPRTEYPFLYISFGKNR